MVLRCAEGRACPARDHGSQQCNEPPRKGNSLKKINSALTAALLLLSATSVVFAQTAPSSAPSATPSAPKPNLTVPSAPIAPVDPLPPADPKNFTAASPTVETVNSFLKVMWGYDADRIWRVMAIQSTPAAGISKVVVFVASKSHADAKVQAATFFVTPDGKHALEGPSIVPFGATPYAETRDLLNARADGASRGAASKDLMLVEFADFQCPYCAKAQSTVDQIVKDFPDAHVVFQIFPLVNIHPSAFKAAAYGVCAQKQSNDAFFKFADGVFDTQSALTPATEDTLLKAAAKRAGLDGDAIAACAATDATKEIVNADIKLGNDAGVEETPMLSINGRMIPLGIPYDTLKQILVYQAMLDGVPTGASADILVPKPVPPTLTTLPK